MHSPGLILALLLCFLMTSACGGGGGPEPDPGPRQTLLTVSPDFGSTAGGTLVTLGGTGFEDDVRVIRQIRFGGKVAPVFTIVDDTTIVVESPPGIVGETVIDLVGDNAPARDGVLLTRGYTYFAPLLYVAEGAGALQPGLLRVDLDSGTVGLVGPIGVPVACMAMRANGVLYAAEDGGPNRLLRIDPETGTGTPFALLRAEGTGVSVALQDLVFDEGGRLLGRSAAGALVVIDIDDGTVATLDPLAGLPPGGALTGAGAGGVYLAPSAPTAELAEHDVLTGVTVPGPALLEIATLRTLAARDAHLFAVSGAAPVDGMIDLLRIDPLTGAVDVAASLSEHARAIARDL